MAVVVNVSVGVYDTGNLYCIFCRFSEAVSASARNCDRLSSSNSFSLSHMPLAPESEPIFDAPFINVTVKAGTTAILPCSVKHLGAHQVVWTDQWSTLLTFEDRRIIDDERISVERPYTKDWNLHIRAVRSTDKGVYNCQVNTSPVKIKTVNLFVQVPAKIIADLSSSDVTALEGETLTLVCNVTGVPMPTVTWYRHPLEDDGEKERIGMDGEVLVIYNVSRYCSDTYECVAFNDVPPAVNRQIKVTVQFPPEVRLPTKRIGQAVGKETILECVISASPHEISVWIRNGKELTDSEKYRIEIYEDKDHTITLSLRIRNINAFDFGQYTCMASNILGKDRETMALYDYSIYTKTTTRSPSTSPPALYTPFSHYPRATQRTPGHGGRTELQFVTIKQTTKHIPENNGDAYRPLETRNTNAVTSVHAVTALFATTATITVFFSKQWL
ncbi:limbic system-associated membrane protein-like [Haliotis asinina]|uniref:limbic system-associated membrane protein-like n=1 Tax=Haliotis asinina TaxID=109174 RepID=UPI0035320136